MYSYTYTYINQMCMTTLYIKCGRRIKKKKAWFQFRIPVPTLWVLYMYYVGASWSLNHLTLQWTTCNTEQAAFCLTRYPPGVQSLICWHHNAQLHWLFSSYWNFCSHQHPHFICNILYIQYWTLQTLHHPLWAARSGRSWWGSLPARLQLLLH